MSLSIGKDGPKNEPAAPPATEPEEWTPWYKKAFKLLQDEILDFDRKKLAGTMLAQAKLAEAYRAIRRGALTREFIEGEFWKEFLHPMLSDEQAISPWKPGDPTDHMAIVSQHLFASGKSALAKALLKTFNDWIKAGDMAKKIVAEYNEKRDRLKDMGRAS